MSKRALEEKIRKYYYLVMRDDSQPERWYIFEGPKSLGAPIFDLITASREEEVNGEKKLNAATTDTAAALALVYTPDPRAEADEEELEERTKALVAKIRALPGSDRKYWRCVDTLPEGKEHGSPYGSSDLKEFVRMKGKFTILFDV